MNQVSASLGNVRIAEEQINSLWAGEGLEMCSRQLLKETLHIKNETSVKREMMLQQLGFVLVPRPVISREEEMKYEELTVQKSFLRCFFCPLTQPLS